MIWHCSGAADADAEAEAEAETEHNSEGGTGLLGNGMITTPLTHLTHYHPEPFGFGPDSSLFFRFWIYCDPKIRYLSWLGDGRDGGDAKS